MDDNLATPVTFAYDDVGDILYLQLVAACAEQESDEVEAGVVVRTNPATGDVEGVEIVAFSQRAKAGNFTLPLAARVYFRAS